MADKEKKYLGIDWGTKRIGLAIGVGKIAVPFKIVEDLDALLKIIIEEEIVELVLGLPVGLHGNTENVNPDFIAFKDKLIKKSKLHLHTIDERLSSKAADALPGNKKDKAPRDAIAAMLILQSYLDGLN